MTRRLVGLLCVAMTLASATLVAPAHARRPDSRLDRLERRVESLRLTVVELESALGLRARSGASGSPERLFDDERSKLSDSDMNRVRRLQRRLVHLDERISELEEARAVSPSSSAVQSSQDRVPRPLAQRRLGREPLRKLSNWLTRLQRKVRTIQDAPPTASPSPSSPSSTPAPSGSPSPGAPASPPPSPTQSPSSSPAPGDAGATDPAGTVGATVTCPSGANLVRPEADLQSALQAAGPGASVCFKPGTYRLGLEQTLEPLAGQTLVFRSGAVLNGSEVVTNWTRQGSYWSSSGHLQNLKNTHGLPEDVMCGENPGACIFEDVFVDDRPLVHVQTKSALDRPNEVFFDKPAGTIYIATDPSYRLVEMTVAGTAISSSAEGVTIRGATIEKFSDTGISTAADRWTIQDSDIRYIHFQGIGIYEGTGHVVQDTRVHHNGVIGMTVVGVDDVTIQGNEFDHNNYLRAGPETGGYHEGSVKILTSHDLLFGDNWSHDNVGDGLWFDSDNYDILIENNVLESNSRNGLHYEASFDATVRYNTIRNNGTDWDSQPAGILNSTSKNVEYYGNRIEDNVIRSIVILWADRGRATLGEHQSANLYFHDNVIVLDDNFQSWVGVYWDQDSRVFTSNNRFQGNRYYARRDGQREGEYYWRWGGSDLTWDQWRAYGFDTTGSYIPT